MAEPDCGSMKAEIDKLRSDKLPEKLQNASAAGAKKYNPTPDEWAAFPRYNNLMETYAVKKCEPSLTQAKAATAPAKTADAGAAMKAASSKAADAQATPAPAKVAKAAMAKAPAKAATTATAAADSPQQAVYQGVMMKIPAQPGEQKQ